MTYELLYLLAVIGASAVAGAILGAVWVLSHTLYHWLRYRMALHRTHVEDRARAKDLDLLAGLMTQADSVMRLATGGATLPPKKEDK